MDNICKISQVETRWKLVRGISLENGRNDNLQRMAMSKTLKSPDLPGQTYLTHAHTLLPRWTEKVCCTVSFHSILIRQHLH